MAPRVGKAEIGGYSRALQCVSGTRNQSALYVFMGSKLCRDLNDVLQFYGKMVKRNQI